MRPVLDYKAEGYYRYDSDSYSDSEDESSSRHRGDLVGTKLHGYRGSGNIGTEDEDFVEVSIGHLSLRLI